MENLFTINQSATITDVSDGIFVRLARIKAIINYLSAKQEDAEPDDNSIISHVINQILLALLDYIEQIDCLYARLSKLVSINA
jgi:hypothetical protein